MEATNPESTPAAGSQYRVITVEGVYQGKNLNVENPSYNSGVGCCVTKVMVNEYEATSYIDSSAFEINFQQFQLAIGDEVIVRIVHHLGCTPKVLNPEVLKPEA